MTNPSRDLTGPVPVWHPGFMPRVPGSKVGRPSPKMAATPLPDLGADSPEDVRELQVSSLAALKQLQAAIASQIQKGEVTAAVQREAAALGRAVITLGSELRQQEKFWRARAEQLSTDEEEQIVTDWLKEQSPARRRRILKELSEMDAKKGLLG